VRWGRLWRLISRKLYLVIMLISVSVTPGPLHIFEKIYEIRIKSLFMVLGSTIRFRLCPTFLMARTLFSYRNISSISTNSPFDGIHLPTHRVSHNRLGKRSKTLVAILIHNNLRALNKLTFSIGITELI
jgi:hypothetical protein